MGHLIFCTESEIGVLLMSIFKSHQSDHKRPLFLASWLLISFILRCHTLISLNGQRSFVFQDFNPQKLSFFAIEPKNQVMLSNRKTQVILALFGVGLPHSQSFSRKKNFDFRPDTLGAPLIRSRWFRRHYLILLCWVDCYSKKRKNYQL